MIFGPQARSKKLKISKDLKSSILSTFITDLIENKRLQALDIVSFEKPSTKLAAKALETAGLKGRKICLIVDLKDPNTISSFSNIPTVRMISYDEINAYEAAMGEMLVCFKRDLNTFKGVVSRWQ